MSWPCPHEENDKCKRLNKACKPGVKGCVLGKKVKFIDFSKEKNVEDKRC